MKVGSWGKVIRFQVSGNRILTFQNGMSRTSPIQFEEHNVLYGAPRLQFIGPGTETVRFTMELNAMLCRKPVRVEDEIRKAMQRGEYYPLIVGGRCILKNALITSMSTSYEIVTISGKIMSLKIDIEMSEYS
nr:MAG TPA: hypothetical protein [Caudoviricetes sp.]